MAFLTLSDNSEKIDVVLFPRVFENSRPLITNDNAVVITGTVDWREDKLSILADKVQSVQDACSEGEEQELTIVIKTGTDKETLTKLNEVLKNHPGQGKAILIFQSDNGDNKLLDIPYGVQISNNLKTEIHNILTATYH